MALDQNPWFYVTLIGQPEAWMALSGVLVLAYLAVRIAWPGKRNGLRKFLLVFLPSLWLTLGLVIAMKVLVPIERPCTPMDNQYCDIDPSFPSGHAATIFSVFASLYIAVGKRKLLPLFIVPAAVALSRVFLGVHNPIDVVTGGMLGIAVSILVWRAEAYLLKAWKMKL